ncbi:hypothetical protein ETAA8_21220 [Anatilimnocola aggregata]|uniref:SAF domain-containing protein n=1 Tax=Anatilimnocola aggregata TaxID=2528021 RepID=A0A517Y9Z9_9BACT|nr:hypothetical protein [Anatilimnocola aggregata]QDU27038.1 hypothetical protein ETAA8_21220 [Anatilimnocola aggregata]
MRGINPHARRTSPMWYLLGVAIVLVFGASATLGTLWAAGVPLQFWAVAKPPRIQIPVNARPVAAYAVVTREDLIDTQKRAIASIELRPEQIVGIGAKFTDDKGEPAESAVKEVLEDNGQFTLVVASGQKVPLGRVRELGGALMSVNDIIGRVVGKDKNPGLAFNESSFLPKGTRPGLAGATPPGMQSITLESSKITGLHGLKLGDTIDLIASIPHEFLGEFDPTHRQRRGVVYVNKGKGTDDSSQPFAERTIAQGALIISPVRIRQKPSTTSSLTQGQKVQNIPVEEVVLALMPADLSHVKKAIDKGLNVIAVAQSGRGGEGAPVATPEPATKLAVAFPLVKRTIPAFQRITDQDFIDPVTRRPEFSYVDPDVATQRKLVPYDFLLGRVASRDIDVGSVISETELAQQGAQGGIGSVIPADRQAVVVDAHRIVGADMLSVGDRLDVLGSFALELERSVVETERVGDVARNRNFSESIERKTELAWSDSLGHRSEHWFVAIDAHVVAIARSLDSSAASAAPTARPVSSLTLAVRLKDAEAIAQAAAMDKKIVLTAAFRSNLPTAHSPDLTSVPICSVGLRAFEALDAWSPAVLRPAMSFVSNDVVAARQIITDLRPYAGRVLSRNKQPGDYFTTADFLPEDAKPGVAAGIAAGHRGFLVAKDQLAGLDVIQQGSRVDVLAASELNFPDNYDVAPEMIARGRVEVAAQNVEVVQVYKEPNRGVVAAVLAIPVEEASRFEASLAADGELRVVPRSQTVFIAAPQANAASDVITAADPLVGAKFLEQLVGSQRRVSVFPATVKP